MTKPSRYRYILPLLVLWLAFGLRLYRIDAQSIWWDEGHSIFVASQPILEIPTLPAMDVHPPAYFILLHLWIALTGHTEFTLRYLSLIFGLLTIALIWRFQLTISNYQLVISNYQSPITNSFASLLASLSPLYVAYSQEVRSYALITCLALASTFVLWLLLFRTFKDPSQFFTEKSRWWRDTGQKRGLWLLVYVILSAACLYTHYFTIFLLLFHNLVWLVWMLRGKPRLNYPRQTFLTRAGLWVASQLGILLLFLPQLMLAWRQVTSYTNPNLTPPGLLHFISRSWQAYTVGLTLDPVPARWGMGLIAGVLVLSWLLQFTLRRRQPAPNRSRLLFSFFFLLSWLLLPLAAYFIILQRQPSFEPRYLILVTPALFLLLALGLTSPLSPPPYSSLLPTPYSLLPTFPILRFTLLALFLVGLYNYYTNETYFKDDAAGVAAWLAAETTPNDIIYVDVPHPFHYYAEQRSIPAPLRYLFVDIHTAANTLTREAAGRDRLFWITWWGSDTDPRGVIPFLAEKTGRQAGQHDFKGYRVTWFDLPAQTPVVFSLPETLTPVNAAFGDVLRLDGLAFGDTSPVNEPVWATLHFTLLRETDVDYKVSLRLRGEAGQMAAQLDKDLLNDRHFRTSAWPSTDPALNQAINVYLLFPTPGTSPGPYRLEVVVYNAGPPYPAEGVAGHESADGVAAILGYILLTP